MKKITPYNKLKFKAPIVLDGFNPLWNNGQLVDPYEYYNLFFENYSFQHYYNLFKEKVLNAQGKSYLPVYRMADGEYTFCIGQQYRGKVKSVFYKLKNTFRTFSVKANNDGAFLSVWGENYDKNEWSVLIEKYIEQLKLISQNGVLALHFLSSKKFCYSEYNQPMCNWFDKNKILLHPQNYTSFYFVYALLSGKDKRELLQNKNILIITSQINAKKEGLINTFKKEGVKTINFYEISNGKSMYDVMDIGKIIIKPDLVLIAAGVGSINILTQLHPLKTVCIDVGMLIDCFLFPEKRKDRIFLYQN